MEFWKGEPSNSVDFTPIPDPDYQDDQPFVLDLADDAVIPTRYFQNSPNREPLRARPMLRGSSRLATRSRRKVPMRRATCVSSLAKSFFAPSWNSITQAKVPLHLFQGVGSGTAPSEVFEPLFGEANVLEVIQVFENRLAGVKRLSGENVRMKFVPAQVMYLLQDPRAKRNIRSLLRFMAILVFFIGLYSILFHFIMEFEGRDFSWITGLYWTLTVMSTLGFGDITFSGDLGRVFSILVLLSGIVFLLIMLPFTFIQFFYAPWLEAQSKSRAPRELPEGEAGHVILIGFDPIAMSLISRLKQYGHPHAVLVTDVNLALDLYDRGYRVVVGEPDDPETYRRLRADRAAMIVALEDDMKNTNIVFTVREISKHVPVVANAEEEDSVDVLELAGATHVFQFTKILGEFLARRTLAGRTSSNMIGHFGELLIVEAPAAHSPLVGRTLLNCGLREATGMIVVGWWEQGVFQIPKLSDTIQSNTVLVLAGSQDQLARYDDFVGKRSVPDAPALILGGGRVGRAAAQVLANKGLDYRIVEKNPKVAERCSNIIPGSAADLETLVKAGIRQTPSIFITTHNDDVNIYLTIYCRRLRPDVQILSRATLDRNFNILHTAGADLVMSHASLAAHTIFNLLRPGKVLMLTEGLNIFQVRAHKSLVGKPLIHSGIREETQCSVIAVKTGEAMEINPDPRQPIPPDAHLILIGTTEGERRFADRYPEDHG